MKNRPIGWKIRVIAFHSDSATRSVFAEEAPIMNEMLTVVSNKPTQTSTKTEQMPRNKFNKYRLMRTLEYFWPLPKGQPGTKY